MKIIASGIVATIAVVIDLIAFGPQSTNHEQENTLRVACFPNIGHSIAILAGMAITWKEYFTQNHCIL